MVVVVVVIVCGAEGMLVLNDCDCCGGSLAIYCDVLFCVIE